MQEVQLRQAREVAGWARLVKCQPSIPWPSHLPKAERLQPLVILEPSNLVSALCLGSSENLTRVATSLWLLFPAYKLKVYTPALPVFGPISGLAVPVNQLEKRK